jgi:chromosome segregation ATPase
MAGIFKKAMGLFVEFEEDPQSPASSNKPSSSSPGASATAQRVTNTQQMLNAEEMDKFEKHFEKLFDQANFPGPDYYEFMKMMETLEAHIKDEKARLSATYASLTIQGLTKEKLVDTASKYKEIITQDKAQFEKIANDKSEKEIGQKRKDLKGLEETIVRNSEMIQKLTKEITEAQVSLGGLKAAISEEEQKLARNKQGYMFACEAMMKKISDDIQKIQTTL